MAAEQVSSGAHLLDLRDRPAIALWIGKVGAVISEHRMDLVRYGFDEVAQEVSGDTTGRFLMQLDEGELRCPVDGDEHVQLAFFGAHLGDIDMEVTDRIALEAGFVLLTLDSGQA